MMKIAVLAALLAVSSAASIPSPGRIVGGVDADIGEYPYQLSLRYMNSHVCGASILSEKWALTAAHCTSGVSSFSLKVVAGSSNLLGDGQKIQVRAIRQHPLYSSWNIDYDISLLELDRNIALNENAQPIALPESNSDPAADTNVTCTGWGTTESGGNISNQLQAVDLVIVDREVCREQYGVSDITDRMICAGSPGKDSCQGDSGGPLVGNGLQLGIVSWGIGCASPDHSGVYSNVGNLRDWIKETSGL